MTTPRRRSDIAAYPLARLFGRITTPLERFLRGATGASIVLVAVTAATLVLANSPLAGSWARFWITRSRSAR